VFVGYLFPGFRLCSDIRGVELIERQIGGLEALVMAGNAILVEQLTLGRGREGRGLGSA